MNEKTMISQYGDAAAKAGGSLETLAGVLADSGIAAKTEEITNAMRECVDAATKFDTAFADVRASVGGTDAQILTISTGIKELALEIPLTTSELAAIAATAGRLGIVADDILAFTRATADLGAATSLTAEEAAGRLAQLAEAAGTGAVDYGRLSEAIFAANNAWEDGAALQEKAAEQYSTAQSKILLCQNAFDGLKTAVGEALLPALEGLAEAGTEVFKRATAFVEEHPDIVTGIAAVSYGVSAFTKTVATASEALEIFKRIAGKVSPLMAAGLGIGVAAAALVASVQAWRKTSAGVGELTDQLGEARAAYSESVDVIDREKESALELAAALDALAGKEKKSAADKAALLELVERLNEAVPGLNVSYDESTDSLNQNTEAILAQVEAKARQQVAEESLARLTDAYVEKIEIEEALIDAQERLTVAQEDFNRTVEVGAATTLSGQIYAQAQNDVEALTKEQEANREEIAALEKEYNRFAVTQKKNSAAFSNMTGSAKKLTETTRGLITEEGLLSKALKEQRGSGELNLDTALALIDAGYENALIVDRQTGAIKLNTEELVKLRIQKIDDQIQTLNMVKANIENQKAMRDSALWAANLAEFYMYAGNAKDGLADPIEVDAQIASLEKLKSGLNAYTGSASSAGSASVSFSRSVKTAAEKELDTFQEIKAELDHEKAMDLINEEAYYGKLKEYRDAYLTDEENLDTYRSITESIHAYDQEMLDRQLDDYSSHLDALTEEYQTALDEIQGKSEEMREKLAAYGGLFERGKNDEMMIADPREQIKALEDYWENLSALKENNISQSLLNEIVAMDVDDALGYTDTLMEMIAAGDGKWEEFNESWEEKQKLARDIADEFYADELSALNTEYKEKLGTALGELKIIGYGSGLEAIQSLIDGMADKETALYKKAQEIADTIREILASAYREEDQPEGKKKAGSHAGGLGYVPYDGYVAELHKGERVLTASEVNAQAYASRPSSLDFTGDSVSAHTIAKIGEGIVNGVSQAARQSEAQHIVIEVPVNVDGKTITRIVADHWGNVQSQRGAVIG